MWFLTLQVRTRGGGKLRSGRSRRWTGVQSKSLARDTLDHLREMQPDAFGNRSHTILLR